MTDSLLPGNLKLFIYLSQLQIYLCMYKTCGLYFEISEGMFAESFLQLEPNCYWSHWIFSFEK